MSLLHSPVCFRRRIRRERRVFARTHDVGLRGVLVGVTPRHYPRARCVERGRTGRVGRRLWGRRQTFYAGKKVCLFWCLFPPRSFPLSNAGSTYARPPRRAPRRSRAFAQMPATLARFARAAFVRATRGASRVDSSYAILVCHADHLPQFCSVRNKRPPIVARATIWKPSIGFVARATIMPFRPRN